jgi:hypothetical protein
MKVYLAFHTYESGHQIEVFETPKLRDVWMEKLLTEYAAEYNVESIEASDLLDLTDGRCNVESLEREVRSVE